MPGEEGVPEQARGVPALLGAAVETAEHEVRGLGRAGLEHLDVCVLVSGAYEDVLHEPLEERVLRLAPGRALDCEGRLALEQLEQQRAEAPDVRLVVVPFLQHHLRREVLRRPADRLATHLRLEVRRAEVRELHRAVHE